MMDGAEKYCIKCNGLLTEAKEAYYCNNDKCDNYGLLCIYGWAT